jgi:hypothetical protein
MILDLNIQETYIEKYFENELFIPIKGYETLYHISNYGKVKALEKKRLMPKHDNVYITYKEKFLKTSAVSSGYLICVLTQFGIQNTFYIHKLVADHFLVNDLNKPCINHIDCIKTNNYYKNLEFVSYSENTIHAIKNGLYNKQLFTKYNNPNNNKIIKDITPILKW